MIAPKHKPPGLHLLAFLPGWLMICVLLLGFAPNRSRSAPNFDTTNPLGFFTNVASRLLASQLNLNLSQLQVYPTNQYTPAVQRLLQVTANIYDATSTNFYPSVFRPVFSIDANTNICICGYRQVIGVSGMNDSQLTAPVDLSVLTRFSGPSYHFNGNVYGIPWIIGARKGLPNFNQFWMLNQVQVTRKLQFTRPYVGAPLSAYTTNQCYVIGISNHIGMNFWNSYSNSYPNPVTVYAANYVTMSLTVGSQTHGGIPLQFVYETNMSTWPGSAWNLSLPPSTRTPSANSFLSIDCPYNFISPAGFFPSSGTFAEDNNDFDPGPIVQFPSMQLATTNWIYAVMLDGSNVIDYVQIAGPDNSTNLAWALADVYPNGNGNNNNGDYYVWATNTILGGISGGILGINQQIALSSGALGVIPLQFWNPTPDFPNGSIADQQAYFEDFFNGNPANEESTIQAPYTPTRTLYCPCLMQANDPLVHYLGSDLNNIPGSAAAWLNGSFLNGLWSKTDGLSSLPTFPLNTQSTRYQPWGITRQMGTYFAVDTNGCNLAFKDPCVIGSDYWNFPTNQSWNLNWLGQVHRGTPWQTVYLKSPDVLTETNALGSIGTNTWMAWTGDLNPQDAALSRPVMDWQLVDTLASLLNTNNLNTQFSVNTPNLNAWTSQFDGFTVSSNVMAGVIARLGYIIPPTTSAVVISSNSSQASVIANAIATARAGQSGQAFHGVGDILAVPQLSQQSPYLNWNNSYQQLYGISDQSYEAIPSQLLPLLRADSIGTLTATNGQSQLQFSGDDGHAYAVQVSADLLNWTAIATNTPVNGTFTIPVAPPGNSAAQFYRTRLVQ